MMASESEILLRGVSGALSSRTRRNESPPVAVPLLHVLWVERTAHTVGFRGRVQPSSLRNDAYRSPVLASAKYRHASIASDTDRRFTLWLRSRSVTDCGASCRLAAVAARRCRNSSPHGYLAAPAT